MSKVHVWLRWLFLLVVIFGLTLFFLTIDRRERETGYLEVAENITCETDSSAQFIASAWQALENENIPRALACSREVVKRYTGEAIVQQRQLGSSIPVTPEEYAALNDVGTAWFIQGEALVAISEKRPLRDYEELYALAAYHFAQSHYPSAYALYATGGYWPVRQAAFCRSYQYFPDQMAQLPAVYTNVYDFSNCYVPSGFMPSKEQYDTTVEPDWRGNPHSGGTCMRVVYSAASASVDHGAWEGVYMQYPANNWGEEQGLDLSRASDLTFWARGEAGGEVVEFRVGGICPEEAAYCDSLEVSLGTVTLNTEWQQYTMDLSRSDRACVIGAFAWVVTARNNPNGATFYLDDIVFVEGSTQQ
jgi:hypothetical protein